MELTTETQGRATIVRLRGEIDLHVAGQVRRAVLAAVDAGGPVVVDMNGVAYIDSSGIASLVEGLQRARARKQTLSLARVPDVAARVMRIARLDHVFTIHDTVADALAGDGAA